MKSPDEFDAWICFLENPPQFCTTLLGATQQVVRNIGWRSGEELAHKSRSIDTIAQTSASAIEAPNQRHSIGCEGIVGAGQLAKSRVVPTHSDDLGIRKV